MLQERWKRNPEGMDTVVTLDKLARNVVDDQSSDDDVVNCRVTVVVKHPSIIKCGISLADVSHWVNVNPP